MSCKMHSVLIFLVVIFIGACQSVPISDDKARVIQYEDERNLNKYTYGFETDNGISREEIGIIKVKDNKEILTVSGSYAFTGDDGKRYIVTYTSDENGYHHVIENWKEEDFPYIHKTDISPEIGSSLLVSLVGGGLG